jgi:hypothetical protein
MSAFACPANISACVAKRNDLQRRFLDTSPHGIPLSFINEGLHGGAPGGAIFPEPISQGMSWNTSLVAAIAAAIAAEVRRGETKRGSEGEKRDVIPPLYIREIGLSS